MITLCALIKVLMRIATQLKRIADYQEEMVIHRRFESNVVNNEGDGGWSSNMAITATKIEDQLWWIRECGMDISVASNENISPEAAEEIWARMVSNGYSEYSGIAEALAANKNTPTHILTQIAECTVDVFIKNNSRAIRVAKDRISGEDII